MSNAKHQHGHLFVLDFTNYAPVTNTVFPVLSEFGSLQCAADTAGIVQARNPLIQKLEDAAGNLRVESV
jgi:hypothetical protein